MQSVACVDPIVIRVCDLHTNLVVIFVCNVSIHLIQTKNVLLALNFFGSVQVVIMQIEHTIEWYDSFSIHYKIVRRDTSYELII